MLIHFYSNIRYCMCQYLSNLTIYYVMFITLIQLLKRFPNVLLHFHLCPYFFHNIPDILSDYHNFQKSLSAITDNCFLFLHLRTLHPLLQLPLEWITFSSYPFYPQSFHLTCQEPTRHVQSNGYFPQNHYSIFQHTFQYSFDQKQYIRIQK